MARVSAERGRARLLRVQAACIGPCNRFKLVANHGLKRSAHYKAEAEYPEYRFSSKSGYRWPSLHRRTQGNFMGLALIPRELGSFSEGLMSQRGVDVGT